MNKRQVGSSYEEMAAAYLLDQGFEIIERNYRDRYGEIDLIVKDGSYLVFVEVKYRKNGKMGDPAEAVNYRKQQRIRSTARYYIYEKRCGDCPCRFDVVAILGTDIRLIRNAF